ncbi:MAG: glycosyltransferase family 2 protein [bacterium]
MNIKLSINLVTWNAEKYLPALVESLKRQTFKCWSLFVLDNFSTDNTVQLIGKDLDNLSVQSFFIKEQKNIGFASAHNRLFSESKSQYILVLNQDIIMSDNCLEKLVSFLDNHLRVGAVAPRLMKYKEPNIIDSLGLKVLRSGRIIDDFAGKNFLAEKFYAESNESRHVFGVSASCAMYRREALEKTAFNKTEVFDESYFSYKEDIDLAYRLNFIGYDSYVLMDAIAFHDRTGAMPSNLGDRSALKNKKKQSDLIKYYSYKNHIATLYKNLSFKKFVLSFPFIFFYELKKFCFFLLFDRSVLRGLSDLWKTREQIKKRRRLVNKVKVGK